MADGDISSRGEAESLAALSLPATEIRREANSMARILEEQAADPARRLSPSKGAAMSGIEANGWTCFHCGEHFRARDEASARQHFGPDEGSTAACLIKGADHGLLLALRDAEASAGDAWHALHAETTDVHKALYAAHSRHGQALTSAEEAGYERGLVDAREEATRSQSERVSRLEEALRRAVETLAASRHLIGKYTPDHHWLPEHDQRIAELRAAINDGGSDAG